MPAETTAARLSRLMALVAYLDREGGAPVAELAARFGVSPARIRRDVELLWVTGTPGYYPDDLIDFSANDFDAEIVTLVEDRKLATVLRLGTAEAIALVAALRALLVQPGLDQAEAARSALAKLTAATTQAADLADAVDASLTSTDRTSAADVWLADLRAAIGERRLVGLDYVSAADVRSQRQVVPVSVFTDAEHWMLAAWDLAADAERYFRLDRILGLRIGPVVDGRYEITIQQAGFSGRADAVADVVVAPDARWRAEALAGVVAAEDRPDGWLELRLAVGSVPWLVSWTTAGAGDIVVTGPAAIRQAVISQASEALAAYGQAGLT